MANHVKPRDCALGITLPLSCGQFLEDLQRPTQKDLVRVIQKRNPGLHRRSLWMLRMQRPIAVAEKIMKEVAAYGVRVVRNLTGDQFKELFEGSEVVTLVAHSTGTHVEFADRLYENGDTASQVPQSYRGIIDLTVCNAFGLANAVKAHNRDCLVVANQEKTSFVGRMSLYKHVIRLLHESDCTYFEAVRIVRTQVLKEVYRL